MIKSIEQTVKTVMSSDHDIVAVKDEHLDVWQIRIKCNKIPNEPLSYVLVTSRNPNLEPVRCLSCQRPIF